MQAVLAASRQESEQQQSKEEILAEVVARFPTSKDMIAFHYNEAGGDKKKLIRTLKD